MEQIRVYILGYRVGKEIKVIDIEINKECVIR